jgi:AcrR family transcriptional regulator
LVTIGESNRDGQPRGSARRRVIVAMTQLAGRDGYPHLTVEMLLAASGVSRATFYQYFTDLEDCLLAAYHEHAQALADGACRAAGQSERPETAVVRTLIELASSSPGVARVLMTEALAAGPAGRLARDALVTSLAAATRCPAATGDAVDLVPQTLVGGIFRFLTIRMAQGGASSLLLDDVLRWVRLFAHRSSAQRWLGTVSPAPLSVGRPSSVGDGGVIGAARSRRERMLRATAAVVQEKGFAAAAVVDIAARAAVSRRAFYNEFADKHDAFTAAYEYGFHEHVSATVPTFFGRGTWPEKVWAASRAFALFLVREPTLAHLGFVECYAVGRAFEPRVHASQLAFTAFLDEGYRQLTESPSMRQTCSELTAASIFEAGYQECRRTPLNMLRVQPLAVYIALAPVFGVDAAGRFVANRLSRTRKPDTESAVTYPRHVA